MSDYDFRTLNDKDFEVLSADLLGKALGHRFERFKAGRDNGVDGRFFHDSNSEVILQCKHWANTSIKQLITKLKTNEYPKLLKLQPSKYLLAISNSLSRKDKLSIFEALSPFIQSQSDIYGREDLNDLIKAFPGVEQRHYKLWLCSSNVISHFLNKAIFDRSSFTLSEIIDSTKLYVPTVNHNKALDKLRDLNVVIITGEPGIGKTTLAEHLCLNYVAEEYQLIKISDDIKEAETIFESEQKQIFYYDDFLGRNYLEALTGNQGSHIAQFMQRIAKAKNKKFILTSRSTILNQGKMLLDILQNQNISRNEFELRVTSLSAIDKAQILYNHIWHSQLSEEFIDELYKDKRYKEIINHRNFNPRLISYITDSDRLVNQSKSQYWQYIKKTLDDPSGVWDNSFIAQQDDYGRAITLLVTLNGRPISQGELADAYYRYLTKPDSLGLNGRRDFIYNLTHLTGSLLNRRIDRNGSITLDLFNPSIGDYVLRRYAADIPSLKNGFLNLRSTSSLKTLYDLRVNGFITSQTLKEILFKVLSNAIKEGLNTYPIDYITKALHDFMMQLELNANDNEIINFVVEYVLASGVPPRFYDYSRVVHMAYLSEVIDPERATQFICEVAEKDFEEDELISIGEILYLLPEVTTDYYEAKSSHIDAVAKFMSSTIDDLVSQMDIFEDVDYGDYDGANKALEGIVINELDRLGVSYDRNLVYEICQSYDAENGLREYYENLDQGDSSEVRAVQAPIYDEIDELFDRG